MVSQDSILFLQNLDNQDTVVAQIQAPTDSLVQVPEMPEKQEGFFSFSELSQDMDFATVRQDQNDWIHVVILTCVVLITLTRFLFRKDFSRVGKSFFSMRESYILERESKVFKETYSYFLSLVFVLSFSLFSFLVFKNFTSYDEEALSEFILFTKIFGVIALGWGVKNIIIHFVGSVFKSDFASYFHRVNNLLYNLNAGVFFIIMSVFIQYTNIALVTPIAIAIVLLAYTYRTIRNFLIGITQSGFSYIYIILYLCALEIVPVLIGIKLLQQFSV